MLCKNHQECEKPLTVLFNSGGSKMLSATSLLSLLFISDVWSQCFKQARLTITAPEKLEAFSESCLEIPCNFMASNSSSLSEKIAGVWIKSDSRFKDRTSNVIFNSSETQSEYPMKLTGSLSEGNCTTLFSNLTTAYSNTYFFRVESGPFKATASCHPVTVKVRDSPPSPEIVVTGNQTDKESVTVTCTAVVPCPSFAPQLRWNLDVSQSGTLRGDDSVLKTQILTTLHLTDKYDGFNVTCDASYPVKSTVKIARHAKTLDVSYGPKNTKVSISAGGLLTAGSWVTLSCSSSAKPPVTKFTWLRSSLDGRGAKTNVAEGSVYRFNLTEGGFYQCEASNHLGKETSTIELTLQGQESTSRSLVAVVAGVILVFLLLCGGVVAVWWFKSRRATSRVRQAQTGVPGSSGTGKTEEIHYGQINFSKRTSEETSSQSTNSRGQQRTLPEQELVYAQVMIKK